MAEMSAGSVAALGTLYDRYRDRAYGVARSVDSSHAEEAVQEAFIAIWDSRATYRPQHASAAPWLLTVVRNRAIDVARRTTRDEAHRTLERRLDDRRSDDDVAADVVTRAEGRRVQVLVARLPDAQQEVIALSFYGQLTHTEIAAQLDLPLGTIKGRMRLGLHKLREQI